MIRLIRPHGAESLEAFSQRITRGLSALLKEHSGKRILLVTHAGIMRTILVHVLSAPLKSHQYIRFPYAGCCGLVPQEDGCNLSTFSLANRYIGKFSSKGP